MNAQRDGLTKQCGCSPEKQAKCPHPWHLKKSINGTRYSIGLDGHAERWSLPLARTRGAAETMAGDIVSQVKRDGRYQERPVAVKATTTALTGQEALTFDQAWPKWSEVMLAGLVSLPSERSVCRGLANADVDGERFGDRLLTDVTEGDIETCFAVLVEEYAESYKKKFRRNLKRVFTWAAKKGYIERSPITDDTVMRVAKGKRREQRVPQELEANLLAAAEETRSDAAWRLVAIITAALDTGLRIGELLALQWRDVQWGARRLQVRAVEVGARKGGTGRVVPLTPRLERLLRQLAGTNPTGTPWPVTSYVFGNEVGERVKSIRKAWVTAVLRAHNVQPEWTGTALAASVREAYRSLDIHFHDLRHECAQRWLAKGWELGTVSAMLGHTDVATTAIYLGVKASQALAQAEAINAAEWAAAGPTCTKPALKAAGGPRLVPQRSGGARQQVAV